MTFTLGRAPESMMVVLVEHADFYAQFRRKDDSAWVPAGSTVELILDLGTREWAATFDGAVATIHIPDLDVDVLFSERPREARLWYIEDGMRILWAQGDIEFVAGEQ